MAVNGTNGYHLTILKNDTVLLSINSWADNPVAVEFFDNADEG